MNKLNNKGFTLVEILAVVSILALIIIIVATNGFGAFDNAKKKIYEQTIKDIEEAANVLMTDIQYCDDDINKDLVNSYGVSTCDELKEKASCNPNIGDDCLTITLDKLIYNKYIEGKNVEDIKKTNKHLEFVGYIEYSVPNDTTSEVQEVGTYCYLDCNYKKENSTLPIEEQDTSICAELPYKDNKESLAFNIICNAKINEGSLTATKLDNGTTPGAEINGINERVLNYTYDDLGISYYYRGNVIDNYVNFAGMCWRIVRIEGNGRVKLILDDKNTVCNDSAYTGDWSIGKGNYGYDDTNINITNTKTNRINYSEPKTKADKSMIKAFYDFQKIFKKQDLRKLKVTNWCLGNKAYVKNIESYNGIGATEKEEIYYNKGIFYYDAYTRLKEPEIGIYFAYLPCDGDTLSEFKDVIFNGEKIIESNPMYVGTITADEAVFAGMSLNETNTNNYLIAKNNTSFWLLTPSKFDTSSDKAFIVNNKVNDYIVQNSSLNSIRPAISLKENIIIISGNGTQSNPYVIG